MCSGCAALPYKKSISVHPAHGNPRTGPFEIHAGFLKAHCGACVCRVPRIALCQNNPCVRKIFRPQFWGRKWVRQFYGHLEFLLSFCRKTSMSIKFLRCKEGVFWAFGENWHTIQAQIRFFELLYMGKVGSICLFGVFSPVV